ncbi:LPXTG cell wall anchor domain-containing protein [Streptomyces sp. RY43-2]|uniref:LPXTG cell wall anchor domain-containing protein n=1 Tax=Streptomyces macrolidinus TaxID=2952607 RepID=A0ABT0ZD30_9ACTN|nr:LAETG motif-containing sortase-dependent surface protein [Streptomyces macrolidinus]MCN9241482.1 LPXTG cell wall anchor domain-containing protein [Streptomyces macrolidinus]
MKLRRAMVTAAATAVIAPLALLSAPVAFASDEEPGTSSSSPAATESTPADDSTPDAPESTPATDEPSSSAPETTPATDEPSSSAPESTPPTDEPTSSPSESAPASPSPSASVGDDDGFDPYNDCKSLDLDENLTGTISGLPSKIVAGSGWHNFKFVVKNDSDKDLKNVWVNAFTEYNDDTNPDDSLAFDLATLQVKQNGSWNDTYHEAYGNTTLTGTFSAILGSLEAHTTATLDMRVSVKASAPAGSSFALSQAVYAGEGGSCYGNGDFYDFEVLGAGSKTPGDVKEATPTGKKPKAVDQRVKPQGGTTKEVTGSLAETGSSSMLPTIGLVGGVAVVAGAGVVFAVRRRKTGSQVA